MGFYDDWVKAADDEAKHFNLICDCLEAMGSHYGALPAHAGMWRAAEDTADDLLGRLAVVPMVLEARGLDVTPGMIEIFRKAGETQALAALEVIYAEEVAHVAYGSKWFNFLCGRRRTATRRTCFTPWSAHYFHGALKPPFNEEKRAEAGIPPDFYWPLAENDEVEVRAGKPFRIGGNSLISTWIGSIRVAAPSNPLRSRSTLCYLSLGSGPWGRPRATGPRLARFGETIRKAAVTGHLAYRLNSALERWFPEQRLFLKSDTETRFIRLGLRRRPSRPSAAQPCLAWTIIASAILMMDSIGAGSAREQAHAGRPALRAAAERPVARPRPARRRSGAGAGTLQPRACSRCPRCSRACWPRKTAGGNWRPAST